MVSRESLAHPAQPSTDRIDRGGKLFRERGHEFRFERGSWLVPSCSVEERFYQVRLKPLERCECADFERSGLGYCEHSVAAGIAQSKSRTCSCCGDRVLGRFLSEVSEDDGLLSWFVGDEICADCIRAGFWV